MVTLSELVGASASAASIAEHLDALPSQIRVQECLALPGPQLPKLFDLVRGHAAIEVNGLVSIPKQTIVYELKNSLPVFNVSQKRFYRPASGEVVGYNHTTGIARLTGPGYFYAINGDDGEIVFDYTRLPDFRPPGWPPIRPNTGPLAGTTYGNMIDYVRAVSGQTVIGAAYRGGKPRNAHFLLTLSAMHPPKA